MHVWSLLWLGKTWKYNLRATQKIPNLNLWIYDLSFNVENKIGTLHGIGLFTFISNLTNNEWDTLPLIWKFISWCWRFHVCCWRFFPCKLSHRYVMKMYCPSLCNFGDLPPLLISVEWFFVIGQVGLWTLAILLCFPSGRGGKGRIYLFIYSF